MIFWEDIKRVHRLNSNQLNGNFSLVQNGDVKDD